MSFPSIATSRPPARGVFSPRLTRATARRQAGFSILEMAIVVALLLIATTLALLLAKNVVRSVHLHQTAANYANLLQQARVRAVQDDKYYSVIASNNSSVCGSAVVPCAFIDLNGNGTYDVNNVEPLLAINTDVKIMSPGSAPATSNLAALFLPSGTAGTINYSAPGPTFGTRGIPCYPQPTSGYTTCPFTTATSYWVFMKNVRSSAWVAITVTPAGRINQWAYSNNTNTWGPLN